MPPLKASNRLLMKFLNEQRGFTLIEILIVIVIISIVSSVALLTMNHNDNRRIESFANELVQTMTLAEEQAMLQPSVLGLSFNVSSYDFASYQPPQGDKKHSWIPLEDRLLGRHAIPDDLELNVEILSHKDEDKENNGVDNLEWCTEQYNNTYGSRKFIVPNACKKSNSTI